MNFVAFLRSQRWLRPAALLCVVAIVVPAAAYGQRAPAPPNATVVHIFGVDSLTGPSAPYGIRKLNGAAIAVQEINEAGGFTDAAGHRYVLDLSQQDMANDRGEAIALMRQAA